MPDTPKDEATNSEAPPELSSDDVFAATREERQAHARFRGVYPPFPENVSKADLVECAQLRGLRLTGRETAASLTKLLEADAGYVVP